MNKNVKDAIVLILLLVVAVLVVYGFLRLIGVFSKPLFITL